MAATLNVSNQAWDNIIELHISHDVSQAYHVRCRFRFHGSFLVLSKHDVIAELSLRIKRFLIEDDDWQKSYLTEDKASWPTSKVVAATLATALVERELRIECIALLLVEELLNV
jgi:hypothetical protein